MRARGLILALAALAGVAAAAIGVQGSYARFTASTAVAGNALTVDRLANYFTVAPGSAVQAGTSTPVASGDVDTLSLAFGAVPSARAFASVFTVENRTATSQTASLSLTGAPQVASATFAGGGTSVTLAAGATAQVTVTTSAATAGIGAGTLRLRLGSSTWLYRDYPLTLAEAPEAPGSPTAVARAAGAIELTWGASATTTNLGGYDVYRGGTLVGSTAAGTTTWTDTATTDGTAYSYTVKARSTDAPPLSSLASATAAATADARSPPVPSGSYVDNKKAVDAINGTAEPGAALVVTRTAPTPQLVFTGTAAADGSYAIDVADAKGVTVTYTVTATDAAGNTSAPLTISYATKF
jgi:hypothetical protein